MATIEERTIAMLDEHETKYEPLRKKWLEMYNRYENKDRPGSITSKTSTNTKLSQAFSIVEQSVARALANPPRFQFLARNNEAYEEVQKYQDFISYQWDKNGADAAMDEIYRWAVITGLVGWSVGWTKTKTNKTDDETTSIEVTTPLSKAFNNDDKDKDTESCWTLEPIKPFDLLWNVEATCDKDAKMLAKRKTLTLEELEAMGFSTAEVKTMVLSNDSYWDKMQDEYDREKKEMYIESVEFNVYEAYVTDIDKETVTEKVVFIIGGEGINGGKMHLETMDNPFNDKFKAIGSYRPTRIPGKFYGKGLIEPVAGTLDAEEDTFNMTMEALWTDISKPMEYNPANMLNEEGISYGPRKLIPVKRLGESVNVLPTPNPNINGASFSLNYLEKNKQNVTAITDYQTGADRISKQQTATEVEIKTMQSDQRSTKLHKSMEMEILNPLGRKVLSLNKQYLSDQKTIFYTSLGKKGMMSSDKIKFKEIDGIEDVVIVRGSTTAVIRDERLKKWMGFWQLALQAVQVGVNVNLQEVLRSTIEEGIDIGAPEVYLPSLQEQEQEDVEGKMNQLESAKEENMKPFTARVAESDNHEVHMQIHEAAISSKGMAGKNYTAQEMQALTTHLNDHVRISGGVVPSHQEAAEAGVAQGVQQTAAPEANQVTPPTL